MKPGFYGPAKFKPAGWASYQAYSPPQSNLCKACGEWAAELDKNGFCKESKCRRNRQEKSISNGQAFKYYEGLPDGVRIAIVNGKKIDLNR